MCSFLFSDLLTWIMQTNNLHNQSNHQFKYGKQIETFLFSVALHNLLWNFWRGFILHQLFFKVNPLKRWSWRKTNVLVVKNDKPYKHAFDIKMNIKCFLPFFFAVFTFFVSFRFLSGFLNGRTNNSDAMTHKIRSFLWESLPPKVKKDEKLFWKNKKYLMEC